MTDSTDESALLDELRAVRAEVERLNQQKLFQNERSLKRVMLWGLVRGLSFGLGSALGATILISTLVWILSSIDFIPVIGDWAQQIIDEINPSQLE